MKSIYKFILIAITATFVFAPFSQALNQDQIDVYNSGVYFFDTAAGLNFCGLNSYSSSSTGSQSVGGQALSEGQIQIAKTIMGIAKTENLDQSAALISLMVGLTESNLTILANSNVPVSQTYPNKQGIGSNGDSVGVFQQQPQYGWSTIATGNAALSNKNAVWQLMDPAYAAEAFLGSPPGSNAAPALSKGLQNVKGWQSMSPWLAAQSVQRSAYPDGSNYRIKLSAAQNLINKYWNDAAPTPLPVPFSGSASTEAPASQCLGTASCNVTQPVYGSVNGSGGEYSQSQLTQLFGDPGTQADHSTMESKQVKVNFLGHQVLINPLAAGCLTAVANDIQSSNINYAINSVGCYRFDSDNGTSNIGLKSYHSYGVACDINPDTNPFVESGTNTTHDMPQSIVDIFNRHGFTWGGNWQKPKDYMHFEFNGLKP
jgi:hypothetical protein